MKQLSEYKSLYEFCSDFEPGSNQSFSENMKSFNIRGYATLHDDDQMKLIFMNISFIKGNRSEYQSIILQFMKPVREVHLYEYAQKI